MEDATSVVRHGTGVLVPLTYRFLSKSCRRPIAGGRIGVFGIAVSRCNVPGRRSRLSGDEGAPICFPAVQQNQVTLANLTVLIASFIANHR